MTIDPDPNRPVVLSDLLTEIEATMVIGYLDSIGIRAMTAGAGGATGWPDAASYTQVVVRHCDEARARLALAEYHDIGLETTESDSLDQDRSDIPNRE